MTLIININQASHSTVQIICNINKKGTKSKGLSSRSNIYFFKDFD